MTVDQRPDGAAELIQAGEGILGIELGSTRIKAALIAPDTTPLASGSHGWASSLVDGVWTYDMADVWTGLAACYASLVEDVRDRYAIDLTTVAAMGVSGMMHGYLALDVDDRLLVPFRTWRNNITGQACAELSPILDFAVPQRWSIAHLYQSILEGQPHVPRIARITTLAGYVHWMLTGEDIVGVGEASGMFPIDPLTCDWDAARMATFDALIAPRHLGWTLADILPDVRGRGRASRAPVRGGRQAAGSVGPAPGGDTALPSRGRRRHRDGGDRCDPATIRERLGGYLGLRDDRARAEPVPDPRRDRHRRHAGRPPGRDGPLEQRLPRPRCLDRPVRAGRQRPRGRGVSRVCSTNASFRRPSGPIRMPAGSCRSTTSRAST